MPEAPIDLRSDTVTRPTAGMWASIQTAQVKHPAIRKRFAGQIICNLENAFKSCMGLLKVPPGPNTIREWNIIRPIAILKLKFI